MPASIHTNFWSHIPKWGCHAELGFGNWRFPFLVYSGSLSLKIGDTNFICPFIFADISRMSGDVTTPCIHHLCTRRIFDGSIPEKCLTLVTKPCPNKLIKIIIQLTTSPILEWFEPSGPLQRAVAGWNAKAVVCSSTMSLLQPRNAPLLWAEPGTSLLSRWLHKCNYTLGTQQLIRKQHFLLQPVLHLQEELRHWVSHQQSGYV